MRLYFRKKIVARYICVFGFVLAECQALKAGPESASVFDSINWEDMNSDDMNVSYAQSMDGSALKITAKVGYLDRLRNGAPITAEHFWWTPFTWRTPEISVKTQNSTDHSILLDRSNIFVNESNVDETPIPIFYARSVRKIGFFNDGWGPMVNGDLVYGIVDASYCSGTIRISDKQIGSIQRVRTGDIADSYSIDLPLELLLKGIPKGKVCAMGVLSYSAKDGSTWRIPFRTVVLLQVPGPGAPAPPNATYDVFLKAGKAGYGVDIPLSQVVPAKGTDNFHVVVFSDKSAGFSLRMSVLSKTDVVASSDIELTYFRPKSVAMPSTPSKLFQSVESKKVDLKQFAPYVDDIKFDPVNPDQVVIKTTEEWMFLTQMKRDALHDRIEKSLRALNLDKGQYCYQNAEDRCVRVGTFTWRESPKTVRE